MPRFWLIVTVVAAAFVVYAAVDCARTERHRVRAIAKPLWILVILLVPVIGGALWFLVGRGRDGSVRRPVAPDDDPIFLRGLSGAAEQNERIRRLEQELNDLDGDRPPRPERTDRPDRPDRAAGTDRPVEGDSDNGSDAAGRRDA